jgi:type IV secretory pathway TraG/TraD family ATPase VirD4
LQKFWSDEFENLSASKQAEVVSPILNKVGQFLSVPLIRNIICQPQSGFSPRWIMDNNKIFLANLSKGKIGEDVSEMLGSMLVSKFQLDVMSRANIAPEERKQYSLYVDEFQNFATESFADIFSEARKYGLGLVIAHQYVGQVNTTLMDAILGNVGNIALFHVGSNDAKLFAPNFSAQTTPTQLTEQPLYAFTLKTSRNGEKEIIHGELVHPDIIGPRSGIQSPEKLQALVRDKFAKKREFVEGKLDQKFFS